MLKISAKLLQTPVLLSSSCSNISCSQMIPLVGHITVKSSKRRKVGGIRVILESRVQRRRMNRRNSKWTWTEGDTIETFEVEVVRGPYWLSVGETRFEFVIEVPVTLVPSRTTAFDKITHVLHAALLDALPCYDRLHHTHGPFPKSGYALDSISRLLGTKKGKLVRAFGMTSILTHSSTPINVFSCDTEEDSTAFNFSYATDMEKLGHLRVAISSQQLVLGQTAHLHVDVSGLSSHTTIHNMTVNLIQTTKEALCPSKHSSSSSGSPEDHVSEEVLDSFQLHTFGIPWPFMHTRPRPYRGSYIWRGSEAANYTSELWGMDDLQADRATDDGFELSTVLTIPSPIIGAMATTSGCDPAFAAISHHLDIRFSYSILDIGSDGNPLPSDPGVSPSEGSVRSWTLEKALEIHSDLSSATATAAPPYSSKAETTHHCISRPKMDLVSTNAHRSTSRGLLSTSPLRPVRMDEAERRARTQRHWDETGGLCACFDQSEVCGCARTEVMLRRQDVVEKCR